MSIQIINTGTSANAGNGDSIRLAFTKVNNNFDFLNSIVAGTGTSFSNNVENVVTPMFVHSGHSGIQAVYDIFSNRINLTSTGNVDNLHVRDLSTLKDVIITGTVVVGLIQGFDDFNIIKFASDGSLNFRIKNTFNTGTSQINLLDNTAGSFNIVHQNSGTNSGLFFSGQNYIFDDRGRAINIGRNSDINFYSTSSWLSYSQTPAFSIKSTGTVNIDSTLTLTKNFFSIGGNTLTVTSNSIVINNESSFRPDRLTAGRYTATLTTAGNFILPGNNILEYTPETPQGQPITNYGAEFSSIGPFSGVGSIYFNGNERIEVQGGSIFDLVTATYTVEWFQRPSVGSAVAPQTSFMLGTSNDQTLSAESFSNVDTSTMATLEGTFNLLAPYTGQYLNTWTHLAIVKTTSTFALYVNGVRNINTASNLFPTPITTTSNLIIGSAKLFGNYVNSFTGYISNMRWEAREVYTGSTFTPPTSVLTATTATRLLLSTLNSENYLIDNSGLREMVPSKLSFVLNTSSLIISEYGELTLNQKDSYDNVEIPGTLFRIDTNQPRYSQISVQNHNTGSTATSDIVFARDDGDIEQGVGVLDIGINSSNYQEVDPFGIHAPGSAYIFTNDADLVIGTQSPSKRLIFHAGGSSSSDSAVILDEYVWQFNRSVQTIVSTPTALNFTVRNTSNNSAAEAVFQAMNNAGEYLQMGIKTTNINSGEGSMGPKSGFLHIHGTTSTLHIGKIGDLAFWSDEGGLGFENSVTATLYMSRFDRSSKFGGNVIPADNLMYDLGSASNQWRSLYVGTGTIYLGGIPVSVSTITGILSVGAPSTATTAAYTGYIGLPQNLQTAGYTLVIEDQGKHIYCTGTNFTVTIPASTVTNFPIGSTVAFISAPGSTATISIDSDTLYLVGSGLTGSRTLAPYGMATAVKVDAVTWFISGTGLT